MRLRLAAIAFLLGSLSAGVCWLTLQPIIIRLMNALNRLSGLASPESRLLSQIQSALPLLLALDLLMLGLVCFALLHMTIGRPLRATESAVEQLSRLELDSPLLPSGGPLLSRLEHALGRTAEALREERVLTQKQLRELTAANQFLSRAQTELVATARLAMVGELAAGVAHEVGNPLSGILGYLSVVKMRSKDAPETLEHLARIEAEVLRIDQIVRGMLDLGRPSRGELVPVEVEKIVDAATKLVRAGPDFAGVKVTAALESGLVVKAESGPLSQVLINLLLNAAQAMNGSGQVTVRGRAEGENVVLEVEDSGPGLTPDVQQNLFRPFFTTKLAGKGTGLGLAVSLHLVRSMNGRLGATNSHSGGACFTLRLSRL